MEHPQHAQGSGGSYAPNNPANESLPDLPADVLRIMFCHLRRRDCPAVRLTCRHWRDVLDSCLDSLKLKQRDRYFTPQMMTRFSKLHNLVVHRDPWFKLNIDLMCLSACCTLETIVLHGCDMTDLRPLALCPNLSSLFLTHCAAVSNVQPLAACTNLTQLDLACTPVANAGPLAACAQLKMLSLSGCTKLTTLGKLVGSTSLEMLDISQQNNVKLQDLGDMSAWRALQWLNLSSTPTCNLVPLAACTTLTHLDLLLCGNFTHRHVANGLASCRALKSLSLGNCAIKELEFIPVLWPALLCLDLCYTDVEDITPLSRCTLLQKLRMLSILVKDIAPLSSCRQLDTVEITRCAVSDIAALASCTRLEALNLHGSSFTDISALVACTNLRHLVYPGVQSDGPPPGAAAVRTACPCLKVLSLREFEVECGTRLSPLCTFKKVFIDSIST